MHQRARTFSSCRLLLAALLVTPFLPVLLAPGGRVLGSPNGDGPQAFYYYMLFAGRCWRGGIIPLWNPHILLGTPFLGEGQAAVFHPFGMLTALLPAGAAINWITALAFTMGGLFFYGWLRALRLGRPAAFCGALAWSFSSALAPRIYAGHLPVLLVNAAMPLVMMLWERWRATGRAAWLIGIAPAYGSMILAGHPQTLFYFSLFFVLYAGITARPFFSAVIPLALGVGLGAVQLLPSLDFLGESARRTASFDYCAEYSFWPKQLVSFIAPFSFGIGNSYCGYGNFWEMTFYLGVLPLVLVPLGIMSSPPRRRAALAIGAVLFFLLALGWNTPLFKVFYRFFPLYDVFRVPARHLAIVHFCLATFAAQGIQRIILPTRGRLTTLIPIAFACVLILCCAASFHYTLFVDDELVEDRGFFANNRELLLACALLALCILLLVFARRLARRRALVAAIAILILVDLAGYYPKLLATYDEADTLPNAERLAPLRQLPYPARVFDPAATENNAMASGLSSPAGYVSNTLARYNRFICGVQGLDPATPRTHNQVKTYAPLVRYLAPDAVFLPERGLKPGMEVLTRGEGWVLARVPEALPRAFLAEAPQRAESEEDALKYIMAPENDLRRRPVIETKWPLNAPPQPAGPDEGVRMVSYSPNRVELEARAATRRVLVLCDAFEKNWTARVNGAMAPIYPANAIFRAVKIQPGVSKVIFEYQPRSFAVGAVISMVSLVIFALLLITARLRSPRTERVQATPQGD